jgi:hypothetical protein
MYRSCLVSRSRCLDGAFAGRPLHEQHARFTIQLVVRGTRCPDLPDLISSAAYIFTPEETSAPRGVQTAVEVRRIVRRADRGHPHHVLHPAQSAFDAWIGALGPGGVSSHATSTPSNAPSTVRRSDRSPVRSSTPWAASSLALAGSRMRPIKRWPEPCRDRITAEVTLPVAPVRRIVDMPTPFAPRSGLRRARFFENGRWDSPVETGVEGQSLTPEDQLFILMQAGLYLTATRGHSAPEGRICYERVESLCHSLNRPVLLYSALIGQWRYSLYTDKLSATMQIAKRAHSLAQEQNDSALLIGAHRALAVTLYYLGDFEPARQNAMRGVHIWRLGGLQSPVQEVSAETSVIYAPPCVMMNGLSLVPLLWETKKPAEVFSLGRLGWRSLKSNAASHTTDRAFLLILIG